MKKVWIILLVLLMFSSVASATKTESFQMYNNTGLNFEHGYYKIEVVDISKPGDLNFAKVNITLGGSSETFILYDSEAKTPSAPYNKTTLTASMFNIASSPSFLRLNVTYPDDWNSPVKYTISTPATVAKVKATKVPNIIVTKSVDKTNISIGDIVVIKITAKNIGNATANYTLDEKPSVGFTLTPGSEFPSSKTEYQLEPAETNDKIYALEAVKSGTFKIESTKIQYGSKWNKSNPLTITVAKKVKEKSNLTTAITVDNNNVMTGDLINLNVKITNTGNVSAKAITVEGSIPDGLKLENGNLRQVFPEIKSGESKSFSAILKAADGGNYTIQLKTFYNDNTAGFATRSKTISVTKKEKNPVDYWYIILPIIGVIAGVLLFTIRRHKEYSY